MGRRGALAASVAAVGRLEAGAGAGEAAWTERWRSVSASGLVGGRGEAGSVLAALAFGRLALERPRLPARRPVQVLVAEPEADLALRRRHRVARVHQVPACACVHSALLCSCRCH